MFYRIVNGIEETIISVLLAAMTLLVFFEVVLRFGFNTGFMWAQEATLHLSAWMVLFGASYGIKCGTHIGVSAFVELLKPPIRRVVSALAIVACLFYCGLFIKGSWVYLSKMHMIGIELEDLPIPKWIAHSILLIGMFLLAFRLVILFWQVFTGRAEGFMLSDEAKESLHLAEETKAALQGGNPA